MSIKGVAFDLEGTLVDLEEAHHRGHLAAAKDFDVVLTLDEAIATIPSFVGGPDRKIAAEIQRRCPRPVSRTDILRRMNHHYRVYVSEMQVMPRRGVLEVLEDIKKQDLPLAIGSLTARADGIALLEKAGLHRFFSDAMLVFEEDIASAKPAPDVYIETARRMGIASRDQLVFEDSAIGVSAAISAGSIVVAVPIINHPTFLGRLEFAGAYQVYQGWEDIKINELVESIRR